MIVSLPDLASMTVFGKRIGGQLRPGDVVALYGDLGAGKTTLARAIIAACGHEGEVPSPTFTILETYPGCEPPLVHADFYRLDEPSEIAQLGLDDYREGAALIAEWPDKAGGFENEPACLVIELRTIAAGREATVRGGSNWLGRLP